MSTAQNIYIGQAGWALSQLMKPAFPGTGTHLERYARQLPGVEINSSFYRPHKPATYERWAAGVPSPFRFAVKAPRRLTHLARLAVPPQELEIFLDEIAALGDRLGPLLVQLPPSLAFDAAVAGRFFRNLRQRFTGGIVCEPRHPSWFSAATEALFLDHAVSRVAADPPPCPRADQAWPGASGLVYYRLHGSPVMYHSKYDEATLAAMAERLLGASRRGCEAWCILDNTASGAALGDALSLAARVGYRGDAAAPRHQPLEERADAEHQP